MKRETVAVLLALFLLAVLILVGLFLAMSTLAAPAVGPRMSSNAAPPLQETTTLTATLPMTSVNGTELPGSQITTTATTSVTETIVGLGESEMVTDTVTSTTPSTLTLTLTATVAPTDTLEASPTAEPPVAPTPEEVEPTETPTPEPEGIVGWITKNWILALGLAVGTVGLAVLGVAIAMLLGKRKRRRRKSTGTRPITPLKPSVPAAVPAPAQLVYVDAGGKTQVVVLVPEGFTVGRGEDNSLVINSGFPGWETVSEHHARILRKGSEWMVVDLNSRNGIYVNERRTGRNLLRDGWKLALGGVVFTFRAGKEA